MTLQCAMTWDRASMCVSTRASHSREPPRPDHGASSWLMLVYSLAPLCSRALQFVLMSRDMPSSFRPLHSAAQLAAADPPPVEDFWARLPPRPADRQRGFARAASESTLFQTTSAHKKRELQRVRVSLQTMHDLAEEQKRRERERMSTDPFAKAFANNEPTRVLISQREEVRTYLQRERAEAREVERQLAGRLGRTQSPLKGTQTLGEQLLDVERVNLPSPVPALLNVPLVQSDEARAKLQRSEQMKQAALLKLFGEHEYKMRAANKMHMPRRYVAPAKGDHDQDRLSVERDSQRLMRKLLLKPRSHTFE